MKYIVKAEWTRTYEADVPVESESEEEARETAQEMVEQSSTHADYTEVDIVAEHWTVNLADPD